MVRVPRTAELTTAKVVFCGEGQVLMNYYLVPRRLRLDHRRSGHGPARTPGRDEFASAETRFRFGTNKQAETPT